MDKRFLEEKIFKALMIASVSAAALGLLCILGVIFVKGFSSLSLDMLFKTPGGGYYIGKSGGIANAILGSAVLCGIALFIAAFVSIPVVLYLNIYRRKDSKFAAALRFILDIMWGLPSIVYGAFGFTVMVFFGMRASLLAGSVTVAFLIIPVMTKTMDAAIKMVPAELLEASYSLGSTRFETAFNVVLRQALPGVLTGILVAFGRGIGDAASVLFTAGFTDSMPGSLFKPVATLPLAIFFQLGTPFPEVQQRGYAAALILTLIVLLVSVASRILTAKFTKHNIK